MMTSSVATKNPFDLDTADTLFADLTSNLVPWIDMADRLHRMRQIANDKGIGSVETSELLNRVIIYVEQYSALVMKRLEKDQYRPTRQ